MSEKVVAKYMGWAIVERSNSPYLTVVGWHNGRRYKESAKSHLQEAARALIKKRVAEAAKHGKLTGRETEKTTFAAVERLLIDDITARGRPSYLAAATYRLKHLRRGFGGMRAADINFAAISRYVAARLKAEASAATVKQETTLLGKGLRLAVQAEMLEHVPPFPRIAVDNARQTFATPAEIGALLAKLPEHVAAVVALIAWTGMRRSEALHLEWSRVDLERQEIALRSADTKTKAGRTFPFGAPSYRLLADMLKRQRAKVAEMERKEQRIIAQVFPDVSLSTLLRYWRKAAKAIGRPDLTRHDLRRSFARNAIDSDMHEGVVMKLAGWKDGRMLDRYNVRSRDDLIEGTAKLGSYLEARLTAPQSAPQKASSR